MSVDYNSCKNISFLILKKSKNRGIFEERYLSLFELIVAHCMPIYLLCSLFGLYIVHFM